jgi:hypothetical protein
LIDQQVDLLGCGMASHSHDSPNFGGRGGDR